MEKDGRLVMSGVATEQIRHMRENKPAALVLGNEQLSAHKYKASHMHTFVSDVHVIVITLLDRRYLGQFGIYYYNMIDKVFTKDEVTLFPGQYPRLGDDFSYWKGEWSLDRGNFEITISDKDEGAHYTRQFKLVSEKLQLNADLSYKKFKDQDAFFMTAPHFDDKRYWSKDYAQLNMIPEGTFTVGGILTDLSAKSARWHAGFEDNSGVYAHQTHLIRTMVFFNPKNRGHHTLYKNLDIYTATGLLTSENARAESDVVFLDKTSKQMNPILQWPDTDNFMNQWRFETHLGDRQSNFKIEAKLNPMHVDEWMVDIGVARQENKIIVSRCKISKLILASKGDDYTNEEGIAVTWYMYHHW